MREPATPVEQAIDKLWSAPNERHAWIVRAAPHIRRCREIDRLAGKTWEAK